MARTQGTVETEGRLDDVSPDRGCQYAPRCTACPWSVCVKDLPTKQRGAFTAALRLVRGYLRAEPPAG